MTNEEGFTEDRVVAARLEDARRAVIYLVVQESAQYIAIMDVLESSITDFTPGEVGARLQTAGTPIDQAVLEARLDKLREWTAVSARTDASRILRHADLLARNWRYTATPVGRQVHRFFRQYLDGTPPQDSTTRHRQKGALANRVGARQFRRQSRSFSGAAG